MSRLGRPSFPPGGPPVPDTHGCVVDPRVLIPRARGRVEFRQVFICVGE